MGVLSGKDLLSAKYTTAIIVNEDNRAYFVPIKYVIGPFFLTELDHQLFCFRLEGGRQIIYRHKAVRSFKFYIFFTDHYLPVSGGDITQIERILKENGLPKVNGMLYDLLRHLGKKEKPNEIEKEFTPHDLEKVLTDLSEQENEYPVLVKNMKNFINSLGTKKIVTPLKRTTEFLEGDLMATDPEFLGNMVAQHKRTDKEQKKMSNSADKGQIAWLKIAIVVVLIGGLLVFILVAYSTGAFNNIGLPGLNLPGQTGQQSAAQTEQSLFAKYPNPEAMQIAINNGELSYTTLPPDIKKMVHPPVITATPSK